MHVGYGPKMMSKPVYAGDRRCGRSHTAPATACLGTRESAVKTTHQRRVGQCKPADRRRSHPHAYVCPRTSSSKQSKMVETGEYSEEEKFTDPQPAAGPRKSPRSLQGRQTRSSGRRRGRGRVTAPMVDRRRGVDRSPPGLPSTRQCWRARVRCTLWTKRKQERGNTQTRSKRGREQYGIARGIARGTWCITVRVGWNRGTAAGTKPRPPKKVQ